MTKVVVANRLVRGGKTYKGGDVVDVSPGEARDLIALGKARAHVESGARAAKPAVKPATKGEANG